MYKNQLILDAAKQGWHHKNDSIRKDSISDVNAFFGNNRLSSRKTSSIHTRLYEKAFRNANEIVSSANLKKLKLNKRDESRRKRQQNGIDQMIIFTGKDVIFDGLKTQNVQ